jgi:hypothetical protein
VDRIDRIGIRGPHWLRPELDPDREDIAERRRRDDDPRRRQRRDDRPPNPPAEEGDDPPHHIDVIA